MLAISTEKNQYLTFASSAPGESSPPLPGRTDGTASDIRRNARAIVSEFERNTQTVVSDIHRAIVKGQEVDDNKNPLVSDTRTCLPVTERPLTAAQTQTRSAI